MKGEYVKQEKDNHHHSTMFSKLHQTQKFNPPPPPPQSATLHSSFQLCQTSEDVDDSPQTTQPLHLPPPSSAGNDGASIEVSRRPRGRPPGSKNKPKPPVIITREAEPSMSPYVLEIPGGVDIVESITSFCKKRNMGLCILNGSGTVTNVTLRQPSTTPGASVTFHGRFDILSLSATVIPNTLTPVALSNGIVNGFTISLAGPQGQVVGGAVVGSLFSAGTVYLIAASFNNPQYHRLPLEDDQRNSGSAGGGQEGHHHSPSGISGGGDGEDERSPSAAAVASSGGMDQSCGGAPLYSCHLPSDVIWAPTARQPPAPY